MTFRSTKLILRGMPIYSVTWLLSPKKSFFGCPAKEVNNYLEVCLGFLQIYVRMGLLEGHLFVSNIKT